MNALLVTLKLEDPVLIIGVGNGEENSIRTLPYITGVALRGALVARYQSEQTDLLDDDRAVELFFGKVHYLNAYPYFDGDIGRMLPRPVSWRKRKGEQLTNAQIMDFALNSDPEWSQGIQKKFATSMLVGADVAVTSPEEELSIHIGSQQRGIVERGESTIFQYQALARGQTFMAAIVSEDIQALQEIQNLLAMDEYLYIGRSRAAGYGSVHIKSVALQSDWQEFKQGAAKGNVTLTCLSDALLRDEYGQPTHDLDEVLSRRFDKPIKRESAFIQPGVVGGFNRKWGLPLPQSPTLGMGSVFVYPEDMFSKDELAGLAADGIGERRVDGYGRLAVNWPGLEKFSVVEPERTESTISVDLSESSKALALTMAKRLMIKELQEQLLVWSQKHTIHGKINNHQLSRLRNVLHATINAQEYELGKIENFLSDLRPTATKQYERARFVGEGKTSGSRLKSWLEERLQKKDGLECLDFTAKSVRKVAGQKPALTDEIKREYTLRLIEALISHKMKDNQKEAQ